MEGDGHQHAQLLGWWQGGGKRRADPGLQDNNEVFFGAGDLSFLRIKERGPVDGPRMVQIEFNELYKVISD